MILINQVLEAVNIELNQEFYAVIGGSVHLCFISESGLYEKVDNAWLLNSEIFARLIFGDCLIIPKYKPEKGKKYYYINYDLDDIANPEKLEFLSTTFTGIADVSRYNIGNCFSNQTEAELCGSYVSKQINKIWEELK